MSGIHHTDTRLSPRTAAVSDELRARIELARLVLISAIVFHHIRIPAELPLFSWDNLGYLRGYLQIGLLKTATSTLTVISGYLCFLQPFELAPSRFVRKKLTTLVVPLIVWNIPAAIMILVLQMNGEHLTEYDDLTSGSLFNWLNAIIDLAGGSANTPLHFLRDIFACNMLALAVVGFFRQNPLASFSVIMVVGMFDLDGLVFPRDDILIGFFLGALTAVISIKWKWADSLLPLTAPLYLVAGFAIFYMQVDYESPWWILHRFLGFLCAWPLIGYLNKTRLGRWLAGYSKHSFFIFLTHYYVGIMLFHCFSIFGKLDVFYIYFMIAGPLTIAVCIAGHLLAARLTPSLLRILTGGRS